MQQGIGQVEAKPQLEPVEAILLRRTGIFWEQLLEEG